MKKQITAVLMLSFIAFIMSGCAERQTPTELYPIDETVASTEEAYMEEATADETAVFINDELLLESEPIISDTLLPDLTTKPPTETEDNPQYPSTQTGAASATPQPTNTTPETAQAQTPAQPPKPQATPAPQPQATPQPTPAPTPEPIPQPTPQPTPEPTPQPTPAPTPEPPPTVVHEPPQARTICNTCGADITGNVAAHGTVHLLNDENFSYRVE